MRSINKIVKESGINLAGSAVGNLLEYIWLVILTQILSQDAFGSFTLAQSVINVSLIFVLLGTPRSLDRFIPFFNAAGEPGKTKSLIRFILQFSLTSSLIVGFGLFLGADFLAGNVFRDPVLSQILKVLVWSIPLLAIIMIVGYTFAGYKELRYHVFLKQLLEPTLKILFAVLVGLIGYGIVVWSWFYIGALSITAAAGVWMLATRIFTPLADVDPIRIQIGEILTYSWPMSIASILMIVIGQVDYLILGIYRTPAVVGVYRIYIYFAIILKLILSSVARINKPVISELIPNNAIQEIKNTYRRITKWILMLTQLGFWGIILYGRQIVLLLFGEDYAVFPQALSILALGIFINASFGPEGTTLEAFGNTRLILVNSLVMLVSNVGLGFLLIPEYGIIGAAISTAITYSLGGLMGFIEISMLYGIQPFELQTIQHLGVGAVVGGAFYFLDGLTNPGNPFFLIASLILFCAVYVLGLYLSGSLDELDREMIRKVSTRFFYFL